jgi:hypothetical protein
MGGSSDATYAAHKNPATTQKNRSHGETHNNSNNNTHASDPKRKERRREESHTKKEAEVRELEASA